MSPHVQSALTRAWAERGMLSHALLPVAWLYGALTALHRACYRLGLAKSHRMAVPVVVVGNVIAGGAGKTPTVLGIVQHLQAQGARPGIVSRGFGGQHQAPLEVSAASDARLVGDEPLLLQHASGVPVVVGRDRVAACHWLLERHPDLTHIVCDDGMQHYRLHRDVEVCVFDSRGLGNQRLLPAGMLRQHWPVADVAAAGQSPQQRLVLRTGACTLPGFSATRALAAIAINGHGETQLLSTLAARGQPLLAMAGIAQPDNFFTMLRAAGVPLEHTAALADHYDFDSYSRTEHERYTLICTEKDATKLWRIEPRAWCVKLIQTLPADFLHAFDAALRGAPRPPLSSRHGHTTH